VHGELPVLIRGAYFRIGTDGALRGPDNAIAATYADGFWQLAQRRHRAFECGGPVCLRLTGVDGQRAELGPFDFVKAAEGAIFTHDTCLGIHDARRSTLSALSLWKEVVFLSAP